MRSLGFQEIARFTRVKRKVTQASREEGLISFDEEVWATVEASRLMRLTGYVPYGWVFVHLTRAIVHPLCNKAALQKVAGGIACLSPPDETEEGTLDFGLVAGRAASLLRAVPAVGHRLGFREVHAFLPHDPRILGAAKAAGYRRETWGQGAILFERRIDLGSTSYRRRPT